MCRYEKQCAKFKNKTIQGLTSRSSCHSKLVLPPRTPCPSCIYMAWPIIPIPGDSFSSARADEEEKRIYIYICISRAHFYTSLTIPASPSSYEAGRPPPRGRPESLRVMTGRPPPRGRSEGPPPRGRGAGVPWVAGWKIKNMHNFFAKRHTGESASCVNSPALRIARASFRRDRRGPRQ